MPKVLIVNGPNLNLLGIREPEVYGRVTMEEYLERLRRRYPDVEITFFQSNHEGEIIDRLHADGFDPGLNGIILNAGAYTPTPLPIGELPPGAGVIVITDGKLWSGFWKITYWPIQMRNLRNLCG